MTSSCDTGVCGSAAPPLIGEILTGTGLTLSQAAAALERGQTPPLTAVQRRIVDEWAYASRSTSTGAPAGSSPA
jgi:hypothetical protein